MWRSSTTTRQHNGSNEGIAAVTAAVEAVAAAAAAAAAQSLDRIQMLMLNADVRLT